MPLLHNRKRMTVAELCAIDPTQSFCPRPSEQFVPGAGGGGGGMAARSDIATRDTRTMVLNSDPTTIVPPSVPSFDKKQVGFRPNDDVKPGTLDSLSGTDVTDITQGPTVFRPGTQMMRPRGGDVESLPNTDPREVNVAPESDTRGFAPDASEFPGVPTDVSSNATQFLGIRRSTTFDTRTTSTSGEMNFRSALRRDFATEGGSTIPEAEAGVRGTLTPTTVLRAPGPRLGRLTRYKKELGTLNTRKGGGTQERDAFQRGQNELAANDASLERQANEMFSEAGQPSLHSGGQGIANDAEGMAPPVEPEAVPDVTAAAPVEAEAAEGGEAAFGIIDIAAF